MAIQKSNVKGSAESFTPGTQPRSVCLVGAIDRVMEFRGPTLLKGRGFGELIIDPSRKVFWVQERLSNAFFTTPTSEVKSSKTLKAPTLSTSRPLEELIWDAAFLGASNFLLDPYHIDERVELIFWPNLTRVLHDETTFSLCAFLSARPSTFRLALKALHINQPDGYAFYNAARASGCLVVMDSETIASDSSRTIAASSQSIDHDGTSRFPFWANLVNKIKGL